MFYDGLGLVRGTPTTRYASFVVKQRGTIQTFGYTHRRSRAGGRWPFRLKQEGEPPLRDVNVDKFDEGMENPPALLAFGTQLMKIRLCGYSERNRKTSAI